MGINQFQAPYITISFYSIGNTTGSIPSKKVASYQIPNTNIKSLDMEINLSNTSNSFSLSIIDPSGTDMEAILMSGARYIEVIYSNNGNIKDYNYKTKSYEDSTIKYSGTVWDFSMAFVSGMSQLNLQCTSRVANSLAVARSADFIQFNHGSTENNFFLYRISDIIKYLCTLEGWYFTADSIEETKMVTSIPAMQNESSISYINRELIPRSFSEEKGTGLYTLSLTETTKGILCTYRSKQIDLNFKVGEIPQFRYNESQQSNIITFSPDVKGSILMSGASNLSVNGQDIFSNDLVSELFSDTQTSLAGTEETVFTTADKYTFSNTGLMEPYVNQYAQSFKNFSSGDRTTLLSIANSQWTKARMYSYSAVMTAVGLYPHVMPGDIIEVIIKMANGEYHHSSGIYMVNSRKDSIGSGIPTTTFELFKNSTGQGFSVGNGEYNENNLNDNPYIRNDALALEAGNILTNAKVASSYDKMMGGS